jgi:hypothetical protein
MNFPSVINVFLVEYLYRLTMGYRSVTLVLLSIFCSVVRGILFFNGMFSLALNPWSHRSYGLIDIGSLEANVRNGDQTPSELTYLLTYLRS